MNCEIKLSGSLALQVVLVKIWRMSWQALAASSGEEQQTSNPILKSPVSCSKSAQFCALNLKN
jgi:hypothetical protein